VISITNGASTLTLTGAGFTSADIGKTILVPGMGAAYIDVVTTITAWTSSTVVTIAAIAGVTLSTVPGVVWFGFDDTTAINAAITALPAANAVLYFPAGNYLCSNSIAPTSKLGLVIYGDGYGVTTVRSTACFDAGDGHGVVFGGQILGADGTNSWVEVRGITWDGGCFCRKAGQQAVYVNCNRLNFHHNRIMNSGEFACCLGRNTPITDFEISNNVITGCFADGINLYACTNGTVGGNVVDGSDDDCCALNLCSDVDVVGNTFRARTDVAGSFTGNITIANGSAALTVTSALFSRYIVNQTITVPGAGPAGGNLVCGISAFVSPTQLTLSATASTGVAAVPGTVSFLTTWGRGIAVLYGSYNLNIASNLVEQTKQYGIIFDPIGGGRPADIDMMGNTVRNVAIQSGCGIYIKQVDHIRMVDNNVYNPVQGACIMIADYTYLTIMGGVLTQTLNTFCRGIWADSGGGYGATWTALVIKGVRIDMLGASTAESIYLQPANTVTLAKVLIDGVVSDGVAGNYIVTDYCGTYAKVVNCASLTGQGIANGGHGLAPTLVNNN